MDRSNRFLSVSVVSSWFAMIVALAGCAVPVDGEDEQVASQTEALNQAGDFQIGIVPIKYVNGKVLKGPESWTPSLNSTAQLKDQYSVSPWVNGFTDPTGFRIGLRRTAFGPVSLQQVDFSPMLGVGMNGHEDEQWRAAGVEDPLWASAAYGVSVSDPVLLYSRRDDSFSVGLRTQPWPSTQSKTLVDFFVGATSCVVYAPPCNPPQYTVKSLAQLALNETTWSHTIDITSTDPSSPESIKLYVRLLLQ